jgi:hypothetical protein
LAKKRARRQASDLEPILDPTTERMRHGVVERFVRPIADEYGLPSRPFRAVDTLTAMERRGSITAEMRAAGEDFRALFQRAHLDPLHAARLERCGGAGFSPMPPGPRIEAARTNVWHAIRRVGGLASPAGSCLWHVVGLEQTIKAWALEQSWRRKPVDQETGAGILIATLGMLV